MLYVAARLTGPQRTTAAYYSEEEETPHLIKADSGQWQRQVHWLILHWELHFNSISLSVALNCVLSVFDRCRIVSLKTTDRQIYFVGVVFVQSQGQCSQAVMYLNCTLRVGRLSSQG